MPKPLLWFLRIAAIALVALLFLKGPFASDSFGHRSFEELEGVANFAIDFIDTHHRKHGRYPTRKQLTQHIGDFPESFVYLALEGGQDYMIRIGEAGRDGWTAVRFANSKDWDRSR